MRLDEFFTAVQPYLAGELPTAEAARRLGGVPAARLGVYGYFCEAHRREILDRIYPHCRAALGGRWDELRRGYFRAHPPHDWELNNNAEAFVAFAAARAAAGELPGWTAELADLEWWEWAVWVAPGKAPPARGRLGVAAGVALRAYRHDLCGFLAGDRAGVPERTDTVVVFWRDPATLDVQRERAAPLELLCIKAAFEGVPLEAAAQQAGVALAALEETARELVAAGILIRPAPPAARRPRPGRRRRPPPPR